MQVGASETHPQSIHRPMGPFGSYVNDNYSHGSTGLPELKGASLGNLGGPIPGLRSIVGMSDLSSALTIPGTPEKTIRQGLQGEYVCLDESLQNFNTNNSKVHDIQTYVDEVGNVACRNKRQKR